MPFHVHSFGLKKKVAEIQIIFIYIFMLKFKTESRVSQAGLEFAMLWRMTLNF